MNSVEKHTLKKDDAVANVVVMMLILSIIVIAFAVIVAVYIPSQKEISEQQHSEDVKEAFLQFASDVDAVYTRGQTGIYSQVFTLGGGDIQFSTTKSAGTVEIGCESLNTTPNLTNVTINYSKSTPIFENKSYGESTTAGSPYSKSLNTISLQYTPVLSFWENQGYTYSKGVVWVNKENVRAPVDATLYTEKQGIDKQNDTVLRWKQSISPILLGETNITPIYGNDSAPYQVTGYNITRLYSLTLVNFTSVPNKNYLSGNGEVQLRISADWESETEYEVLNPAKNLTLGNKPLLNTQDPIVLRVTCIRANVTVA